MGSIRDSLDLLRHEVYLGSQRATHSMCFLFRWMLRLPLRWSFGKGRGGVVHVDKEVQLELGVIWLEYDSSLVIHLLQDRQTISLGHLNGIGCGFTFVGALY